MEEQKKKRIIWTPGMEAVLIALWKKNIRDLRRSKHNGHVYKGMQKEFQETTGLKIQRAEITSKIKNLTRRYREEKMKIETNGGSSNWVMFTKVHAIIGCPLSPKPEVDDSVAVKVEAQTFDFGASMSYSGPEEQPPSPPMSPPKATFNRKRKYRDILIQEFFRANAAAEAIGEERNRLQKEANEILKSMMEINKKILEKLF